jgi:hypothetical protein
MEQIKTVQLVGVTLKARLMGSRWVIYWSDAWYRIYELKAAGLVRERIYGHGIWRDSEFSLA